LGRDIKQISAGRHLVSRAAGSRLNKGDVEWLT
jgi:hypothetical protein